MGPLDLELMLIDPARLLESYLQGDDLNPMVLMFPFLHLWMWVNVLGPEQQHDGGPGRVAIPQNQTGMWGYQAESYTLCLVGLFFLQSLTFKESG